MYFVCTKCNNNRKRVLRLGQSTKKCFKEMGIELPGILSLLMSLTVSFCAVLFPHEMFCLPTLVNILVFVYAYDVRICFV